MTENLPVGLTRRGLLGAAGSVVAALGLLPSQAWAAPGPTWQPGVQLWSVNTEIESDLLGTLRGLARLGFREVETAGLHGHSPAVFRNAIEDAGLQLASAHSAMADLLADPAARIAEAKALGSSWIVGSSPRPGRPLGSGDWITAMHDAMTLDAWKANADRMNDLGRMARAAGLQFAYHNHPFEFERYDGQRGFDVIMKHTDPALVKIELDIAWAVAGGGDPVALLRRYGPRIRLIHIKGLKSRPIAGHYGTDFTTGVVGQDDVIAWPLVLAAAKKAGVAHAFVEQEPPHLRPIMESLAACQAYLAHI